MEGGERHSKRRERWFHRDLNFELVMSTAGEDWAAMGWKGEGVDEASLTSSVTGIEGGGSLPGTQNAQEAQDIEMVVDAEAV